MGAGKKVNTVVLAVKNLPNINTAKFSPAPTLKNTAAALCLLVEGREEQSVASPAIYPRQGEEVIHLTGESRWHCREESTGALFN